MNLIQFKTPEESCKVGLVDGDQIIPLEGEGTLYGLALKAQSANTELFSYAQALAKTQKNKGRTAYLDLMVDARLMLPFHQPDTLRHSLALMQESPQAAQGWRWSYLGDSSQLIFPFWPLKPSDKQSQLSCSAALAACYYIDNDRNYQLVGLTHSHHLTADPLRHDGFDHLHASTFGPELNPAEPWLTKAASQGIKGQVSITKSDGQVQREAFNMPLPDIDSAAKLYFSQPWFCQRFHVHTLIIPLKASVPRSASAGDILEIQIDGLGRALVNSIRAA